MKRKAKIFLLCVLFITVFFNCERNEKKMEEKATKISDNDRELNVSQPDTVNWMGYWGSIFTRRNFMRAVGREFEFLNQDIVIDLNPS